MRRFLRALLIPLALLAGAAPALADNWTVKDSTSSTVTLCGKTSNGVVIPCHVLTDATGALFGVQSNPVVVNTVIQGTAADVGAYVNGSATAATVSAGGTGYAVGDVITETGGTFSAATKLTVTTVSSGAVTAVSVSTPGLYTAVPTNPAAQGSTTGSGSGATFTLTYAPVATIFAAANASRHGLSAQNQSSGDLWINCTATATMDIHSLKIPATAYNPPDPIFVGTGACTVIGATIGAGLYARQF